MKNNKITTYLLALLLCSASCSKDKADSNVEQFSTGKAFNKENNAISSTPGYYNIATYNVRKITSSDTGNQAWSVRRQYVKQMILNYDFDIFGVQEPTGPQIDNMIADLTSAGYAKFGVSDHNDHAYQHQDISIKLQNSPCCPAGNSGWHLVLQPRCPLIQLHGTTIIIRR